MANVTRDFGHERGSVFIDRVAGNREEIAGLGRLAEDIE